MVLVRNQKQFAGAQQKRARFAGRRRVGQASDNAAVQQMDTLAAAEGVQLVDSNDTAALNTTETELAPTEYLQPGSKLFSDKTQFEQFEDLTGLKIATGIDPQGNVDVTLQAPNGTITSFSAPAAVEVPPAVEEVCEFPVQSLVLERQVNITNSVPQIKQANVDRCGNLINYTEQMTRTISAGQWVPVSGMQGDVGSLVQAPNGEIDLSTNEFATYANNLNQNAVVQGLQAQGAVVTTNNNVRVGRRKAGVRKMHASNQNASFALAKMRQFRSS